MEGNCEVPTRSTQICPYSILELNWGASKQEIDNAYRRLALLHHPRRRNNNLSNTKEIFSSRENQPFGNDFTFKPSIIPNSTSSLSQVSRQKANETALKHQEIDHEDSELNSYQKNQEIEWNFLLLNAAYETLSEKSSRKRYDEISNKMHQQTSNSGHDNMLTETDDDSQKSIKEISPTCGSSLQEIIATCSPSQLSKTKGKKKYGIHLKHYSNYLEDVDDDDTTINTQQSSCTFASSNVMLRSHSYDFGGPLSSMYIARNHNAFTDPYQLFNKMFYSDIFHTTTKSEYSNSNQADAAHDDELEQWRINFLLQRKEQERRAKGLGQLSEGPHKNFSDQKPFNSFPLNNISNIKKVTKNKRKENGLLLCGSESNALLFTSDQRQNSSNQTKKTSTIVNGNKVYKTIRIKNGFKMIKTETIRINPKTGKSEKTITVTKEEIEETNDSFVNENVESTERMEKEITLKEQIENWFTGSDDNGGYPIHSESSDSAAILGNKSLFIGLIDNMKMSSCNKKVGHESNTVSAPSLCDEIKKIINSCGPLIP